MLVLLMLLLLTKKLFALHLSIKYRFPYVQHQG